MPSGQEVWRISLEQDKGVSASVLTLGGTWQAMRVPDRKGELADVVLGYDTVEEYLTKPGHLGALVGRNANRIGGASITIDGTVYPLAANNGVNNLHSGPDYYEHRIWEDKTWEDEKGCHAAFSLKSPDGDQGYPGNADITVTYTLTKDNTLSIDYRMICDADTVANFTNHSYFNLAGAGSGDVLKQELWLNASHYTPADAGSIPTGEIAPVSGTPMDFTVMKPIGREIDAPFEALVLGGGYDHNWCLDHEPGTLSLAARAKDPASGRVMETWTTLPGIQFYTANSLGAGVTGKGNQIYGPRHAFCLETQYYPDACHKANFQSPVLKAGEEYHAVTQYRFGTEQE